MGRAEADTATGILKRILEWVTKVVGKQAEIVLRMGNEELVDQNRPCLRQDELLQERVMIDDFRKLVGKSADVAHVLQIWQEIFFYAGFDRFRQRLHMGVDDSRLGDERSNINIVNLAGIGLEDIQVIARLGEIFGELAATGGRDLNGQQIAERFPEEVVRARLDRFRGSIDQCEHGS